MKTFYLARISDGHRFEGSKISANSVKHAEETYRRLKYSLANLMIVGAKK